MKKVLLLSALLYAFVMSVPSSAIAEEKAEMVAEKMAIKLVRGITNTITCFVEFPRQTIITTRDMGPVGVIIGPIKGVEMTLYRGVVGVTETLLFIVPSPGDYDPMMDPEYVWQGW